jgi:hypothetical protein
MIFQNFQARENAKRVGDEIAAELGGIGRAGRLLLWRALQNATRLACRLSLVIDCESAASEDLNEDENRADF